MDGGREILQRVAPLLAVVRGTVGTDPDLAAQWDVNEGQRRTAFRALADLLADRKALRSGLTVEDAADLAFLIHSAENYIVATRHPRLDAGTLAAHHRQAARPGPAR